MGGAWELEDLLKYDRRSDDVARSIGVEEDKARDSLRMSCGQTAGNDGPGIVSDESHPRQLKGVEEGAKHPRLGGNR